MCLCAPQMMWAWCITSSVFKKRCFPKDLFCCSELGSFQELHVRFPPWRLIPAKLAHQAHCPHRVRLAVYFCWFRVSATSWIVQIHYDDQELIEWTKLWLKYQGYFPLWFGQQYIAMKLENAVELKCFFIKFKRHMNAKPYWKWVH